MAAVRNLSTCSPWILPIKQHAIHYGFFFSHQDNSPIKQHTIHLIITLKDETTARVAVMKPTEFRAAIATPGMETFGVVIATEYSVGMDGVLQLELAPYALATITTSISM
jgi:hypothetical protein